MGLAAKLLAVVRGYLWRLHQYRANRRMVRGASARRLITFTTLSKGCSGFDMVKLTSSVKRSGIDPVASTATRDMTRNKGSMGAGHPSR